MDLLQLYFFIAGKLSVFLRSMHLLITSRHLALVFGSVDDGKDGTDEAQRRVMQNGNDTSSKGRSHVLKPKYIIGKLLPIFTSSYINGPRD